MGSPTTKRWRRKHLITAAAGASPAGVETVARVDENSNRKMGNSAGYLRGRFLDAGARIRRV